MYASITDSWSVNSKLGPRNLPRYPLGGVPTASNEFTCYTFFTLVGTFDGFALDYSRFGLRLGGGIISTTGL